MDKEIDISPEAMSSMGAFVKAAWEACVEIDKDIVFICPLCNGEAHVFKTSYNGHRRAHCTSCQTAVME